MIIDWHAHVYPPELARERRWGGTTPLTIENLLEAHEKAGIDRCVVSNTIHYLKEKTNDESLAFLRRWNEYAAEIQQKYQDRIIVFTSTLPCGGAPFVKELERAIVDLGLHGVLINSSHQRAYPDDDEAKRFFEIVTSLKIPVMMHAPSVGFGEERMRDYRLASSVGRPFDECLTIARMIVRGVFERHTDMKFVGCHLGGGICDVIGRMDYAYELGDLASGLGSYEPMLITKRPSEYLKRFTWTPLPTTRRRSCAPTKQWVATNYCSAATLPRSCHCCRVPRKSSKICRPGFGKGRYFWPQCA